MGRKFKEFDEFYSRYERAKNRFGFNEPIKIYVYFIDFLFRYEDLLEPGQKKNF